MAVAAGIQSPEGRVLSAVRATADGIAAPGGRVLAAYNIPAQGLGVEQARVMETYHASAPINVEQARILAVVRGRVANPKLRVFTFTLDEHDFYVVRLGDKETIVYDTYSQQWPAWSTKDLPFWRANCGTNWLGAQRYGPTLGSDIVIGDDTFGLLWFLDPNQAYDDAPDKSVLTQQQDFPRIAMGQVTARGREFVPCFAIFLDGDNFGLSGVTFAPQVTLSISDDQGVTFDDMDTLDVILNPKDATEGYIWTSLGQISSPGRLFRIADNGVFSRIDSMEMNDG